MSARLTMEARKERDMVQLKRLSYVKLTGHYIIAFTEGQCYYKTIADLINGNETER